MSSTDILNLRKEVQALALNIQNDFLKNQKDNNLKAKYLLIATLYKSLLLYNNEKDIRTFLATTIKESKSVRSEYDSLYDKYKSTKKSSLVPQINILVSKINLYNQFIGILNKHLNKGEEKKTPKPVRDIQAESFDVTLTNYSNQILELSNKLKKLDPSTSEAETIRKKIYDLKLQRETEIYSKTSSSYIKEIGELESIELRIVNSSSKRMQDYEVDGNRYVQELRTTINAINEYHFIEEIRSRVYYDYNNNLSDGKNNAKIRERFIFYINKFNNLVLSLFGNKNFSFHLDGETVSIDNLLSYLEMCNLDGGFDAYKSKYNKLKIGNESPNRKMYEDTLEFLNKCIDALCNIAKKRIGDKKVTIKDFTPSGEDLLKERNKKIREINNIIINQKYKGDKHEQ